MNSCTPALARLVLAAFALVAVAAAYLGAQPPRALPLDAAPADFSGQRALQHSYKFATEPRPRGGHAAARGRDYLVRTLQELGLEVEVQRDPVNHGMFISFVENVIARIPGTASTQTTAMTAHYDSVAWGPGAADDGSGVVVMLEVARALKCSPPLKHDVVFIFTGDEEGGGNGSVKSLSHRWLKDLNIMLGLEGRGSWGTAYMFETSEGNLPLMYELKESGAPAVSNSIMYQVHSRTPNTTDFTHMANNGALGYNVAFVGGLGYYHTANDTPQHLSPHTLQHQGEYIMALVRHYDNDGPKIAKGEDAVFFNTLGTHLVVYPASLSRWFAMAAGALFVVALGVALYTGSATVLGTLGALVMMLAALAVTSAIGGALQYVSYKLFYVYIMYNAAYYHIAFMLLGTAIAGALIAWWRERLRPENVQAALLLIFLAFMVAQEIFMPITSYSTTWPLFFGALALGTASLLRRAGLPLWVTVVIQTLGALPAIAFLVPGMHAFYHMGGALSPAGNSALFLIVFFCLTPAWLLIAGNHGKRVAQVAALLAALVFLAGWGAQRFSSEKPKMNSLTYALNLDNGKALWLSTDTQPDEWVSQFIPADQASREDYSAVLPTEHGGCIHAPAPPASLAPSKVEALEDSTVDGKRTLVLRYTWSRSIEETRFEVPMPARVLSASVDGMGDVVADMSGWNLNVGYLPYNGEMTLRLTLDASVPGPMKLQVVEDSFHLPELTQMGYRPRPEWMIPKPNTLDWWESNRFNSHHTYVTKTWSF